MSTGPVTVKEVEEARDSWIAAVKKGSVDDTVALYDPDVGKLLGTVDLDGKQAQARFSSSSLPRHRLWISIADKREFFFSLLFSFSSSSSFVRSDVRTGKDKIREYFVGFLQTSYDTVVPDFPATISEGDIQQLGPGVVAYSGYYRFDLSKNGAGKVANAKFTYIYKRGRDGKLKILLHNSGFIPAGAVAK